MKAPPLPSDRSVGVLFAVVCGLLAGWFAWRGRSFWPWLAGASVAFLVVSYTVPKALRPLNIAWMKLGLLLSAIVSPIVLGIIFFIVITPVALFFRVTKRDALKRKFEPQLASYWADRDPPGPNGPESFPRQF